MGEKSSKEQILHIFKIATELSLPICQSAMKYMFSSDVAFDRESVDALSAALLDSVKAAIEEDQSAGLGLLATLDTGLTDKVSYLRVAVYTLSCLTSSRYGDTLNARSSTHHLFSPAPPP